MAFGVIQHKLDYVTSRTPDARLSLLHRQVTAIPAVAKLSPSAQELMVIETLYLLLLHKKWHHLPLFQDLAREFLQTSFNLLPSESQRLWEIMSFDAASSPTPLNETDFLIWLVATSTLADTSTDLMRHTGFGPDLIGRLKKAAKAAFTPGPSHQKEMLNELDQKLLRTTVQLADAVKEQPWHLERELLRYHLGQLPEPWQTFAKESSCAYIHELLAFLVTSAEFSTAAVMAQLVDTIDGLGQIPELNRHTLSFLDHLQRCQLIFAVNARGKDRLNNKWRLAPLGEKLAAKLYLKKTNPTGINLEEFGRLRENLQIAYLEQMDTRDSQLVENLLGNLEQIKPLAINVLVRRSLAVVGPTRLVADLITALDRSKNPWIKRAILAALSPYSGQEEVRHFAREVAQFDPSPLVREEADNLLQTGGENATPIAAGSDLQDAGKQPRKI